jgi:hypothetical protein
MLLILSPLLSSLFWGKTRCLPHVRQMSIIAFLVMSLGFLVYAPDILGSYPGLKQRFFHIGWSIWFFYLGYSFTKCGLVGRSGEAQ